MATNRASTVHDIQVNAAAVVLGEALHYSRQQAYGLPFENWHSASVTWKQACIERAAYALETLKPIVERPNLAMVKAPSPNIHRGSEDRVVPSGGEIGTISDDDLTACLYCGCAIGADSDSLLFCCGLCSIGWAKEKP